LQNEAAALNENALASRWSALHEGPELDESDKRLWRKARPVDSPQYNEETYVKGIPYSVEHIIAIVYCFIIASSPLLLTMLADEPLTRAHMLESVVLIAWLAGVMFIFIAVIEFRSSHWEGYRSLTCVEAVYLLSQILTTVGYGDITPAHDLGEIWIGFHTIVGLCVYGSSLCEVVAIIDHRIRKAYYGRRARQPNQQLKDWVAELTANQDELFKNALRFVIVATLGVLFWYLYPGEDKTLFQAIYFSIITMSTVGFGQFTATTEGGKVFAAFWMLCGVGSLGALMGSFISTMAHEKKVEARRRDDIPAEIAAIIQQVSWGHQKMTKAQFLKFAVMLKKGTSPSEFDFIEKRFEHYVINADDGRYVRRNSLVDEEGPPLGEH